MGVPEQEGITSPPSLPLAEIPLFGPWRSRRAARIEGPPDGLTLDPAIERLVRETWPPLPVARAPPGRRRHPDRQPPPDPLLYVDSQWPDGE